MIATLFQKVELRFWDAFLPLLTESPFVRKVVKAAVSFYHNDALVRQVALVAMLAFMLLLAEGLVWAWHRGHLNWS